MPRQQYEMLSFGVLLVIVAFALVAYLAAVITGLDQMIALIIAFYGVWTIALAGIQVKNPDKYGRSAYNTVLTGIVLIALGGSWFLFIATQNVILSIVLLLLVIGIIAVISAIPSMRKK